MTKQKIFSSVVIVFLFSVCAHISLAQAAKVNKTEFEFYRNLIFVKAKINGQGPFTMMLDTGTSPSAIDSAVAKRIGLNYKSAAGTEMSGGGTDNNQAYDVEPLKISIGNVTAKKVEFSAGNLSAISKALGKPVDGILGHSFLNNRIIQIDFPKRLIHFYPRSLKKSSSQTLAKQTTLPFRYASDSILIENFEINGKAVTALFDTGLNGAFAILPWAVESLDLKEEFNAAKSTNSAGFNGASTTRLGAVQSIKVGNILVNSPSVVFWEKGTGHDTTSYSATVGNGFLKDFVVTIDYPHSIITLE